MRPGVDSGFRFAAQCLRPTICGRRSSSCSRSSDGFVLYIELLAYSVRDPGTEVVGWIVLALFFFVLFMVCSRRVGRGSVAEGSLQFPPRDINLNEI